MKINPKIAKTPDDLKNLEFKKMKALVKKELKRLEKYTTAEAPTQCIILGEFDYKDKPGMALPLFGSWKGKFKEYAKKEVAVKEPLGAIGSVYYDGMDESGQKVVRINLAKGKGKAKVGKIQRTLKKLIPQATYNVVFGEIDEQAMESLDAKLDAAPELDENFEDAAENESEVAIDANQDVRKILYHNFKELTATFQNVKTAVLPRIRANQPQEGDADAVIDLDDLATEWISIYNSAEAAVQTEFSKQFEQVNSLKNFNQQLLAKVGGTAPGSEAPASSEAPTGAPQAQATLVDDNTYESAAEAQTFAKTLHKLPWFQPGHAFIPFTGRKTGTKYKKGDKIDPQDSNPTWCNQFMYEVSDHVLGNASPFNLLPMGEGWTNANTVTEFLLKADGVLVDKVSGEGRFAKAWEQINKGKMVFFCHDNDGGIGHVATGVPTPTLRDSKHAPNDQVGRITQAGSKVGEYYIDEIWQKSLAKVEIFVSRINEKLPNDAKPDPNLHLAIYDKITHAIGEGKVLGKVSTLDNKYGASELQDVIGSIRCVQQLLVNAGQSVGKKGVDGDAGASTVTAIKNVQKEIGVPETGYIEYGDATWNHLKGISQPLIEAAKASLKPQLEPPMKPEEVKLSLKGAAKALKATSEAILREILAKAGEGDVAIVNTERSAEEQASIMYLNIEAYGPKVNAKRYKTPAKAAEVVKAYEDAKAANKTKEEIIGAMLLVINRVGAATLSGHCASNPAIDIHPSSIKNKGKFEQVIKADPRVTVICPPKDTTYHIEFK